MAIVDRLNIVATFGTNTGKVAGDVRMKAPKQILLAQSSETGFSNADLTDSASLAAAIDLRMSLSRTDPNKLFYFNGFHEADDNTGDPNVATLQDGYEEVLNEAIPKYTLRHTEATARTQAFSSFNGFTGRVYIIDAAGTFFYVGKQGGAGGGQGFDLSYLYSTYPRWGASNAINTGTVRFTIGDIEQLKGNVGAVSLAGISIAGLANMVDVQLLSLAAPTGYAFKLGAKTKYSGTDIYSTYKDLLNVVGAWKITRMDDGSSVTVASVAKDDVLKGWTVTAGSSPTIATGILLKFELVDPVALAALTASVEGIESVYVKIAKP
jgi:hypothetical protein